VAEVHDPWGFFSTFFVLHLGHHLPHRPALRRADLDRRAHHPADDPAHARLSEPTLVTAVLVEPNVHVKRGTPLFQFDRRIYEAKVKQLQAQLAQAKQNVLIMKADIQVTAEKIVKLRSELEYARYQEKLSRISPSAAPDRKRMRKSGARRSRRQRGDQGSQAEEQRSRLKYQSEIGGVNTLGGLDPGRARPGAVLSRQHADGRARGRLHHEPAGAAGMVAGDIRFGAIASFICDDNRYLLANFFQENLKYVKPGNSWKSRSTCIPADLARQGAGDLAGKRRGQMLPSGTLPNFHYVSDRGSAGTVRGGDHAGRSGSDQVPDRHAGRAAIYTNPDSAFVILRKIAIRGYTWYNWLYPFSG
jgi:hypothetical protein